MNISSASALFRSFLEQFTILTDEEWNMIAPLISPLYLKKKEFLMQPHSKTNVIAFILSGVLRTYFISEKGEEFTTDFCKEGEIAVNYRINSSLEDDYFTRAVVNSELLVIDYRQLLQTEDLSPKWQLLQSKIVEYYHPLKLEREKALLAMDAREKYLSFLEKYQEITPLIPQYQIASYLGITPIALSRVKKNLSED